MRRFDCFLFAHELDLLECRLTELADHVDFFVLVEAPKSHQNKPKPLHYAENADRFARWADQIIHVVADDLPDDPDPWSREHAQREAIRIGLERADVRPDDLIFQSDADEIPRTDFIDLVNPAGFTVADMEFRCFAVDWHNPERWRGTCAAYYRNITTFTGMRDARLTTPDVVPFAGWHFTWVGTEVDMETKLDTFCHSEIKGYVGGRLGEHRAVGMHVDGVVLQPCSDDDYPTWIRERKCPVSWWRPVSLRTRYQELCDTPSDINEHLPLLAALAAECDTVLELGTRDGVSTVAFLAGLPRTGTLHSVDIHEGPALGFVDDRWTFHRGDDLVLADELPDADLVFIDTSHLYEHTLAELEAYTKKVRPGGWLVLHDTELAEPYGHNGEPFPVKRAVTEFCDANSLQWVNIPDNNGLAVVSIPEEV